MDSLLQDIRHAVRLLASRPGFALVAILTLGLGIGANATVFTWAKRTLLEPMPGVRDASSLVALVPSNADETHISISYPDYLDFRDRATTLDGLFAFETLPLSHGTGEPERVWAMLATGNYFDMLGVRMARGRGFLPEEDATVGTHPVVVVSHAFWQRRLGGDESAVGQTIVLNNTPFTVVGVAAEEFRGTQLGLVYDVWVPMAMQQAVLYGGSRLEHRGHRWLDAMARLKPGVSIEQAAAEVDAIAAQLAAEYPDNNRSMRAELFPLHTSPKGGGRVVVPVVVTLFAVVGLVLLIACANVANLLLARATERRREIAIRVSLGASRWRVARQMLTESLILALLGGAAGLLVASWASGLLTTFLPDTGLPIDLEHGVDLWTFGFAAAVALATGLLFGTAPALAATGRDVASGIKEGVGTHSGGGRAPRLRNALVVTQIAVSLLLLVAAALLLQSLRRAQTIDPGFNPRGVVIASTDFFASGLDRERGLAVCRELLDRCAAVPGVESATVARRVPLGFGGSSSRSFGIEGYEGGPESRPFTHYNTVGPDYLKTMQIRLVAGRDLARADDAGAPRVAVVNEALAKKYWNGDALGKRIRLTQDEWTTIVGIAADSDYRRLDEPAIPFLYVPVLQNFNPEMVVHVRTGGEAAARTADVRAAIQAAAPGLLVYNVTTLEEHVKAATFQQRAAGTMLAIFGGLALALAAVGVYGVLAFMVSQRTREFGIRMALGADRRAVIGLVLGKAGVLIAIGAALGLAGALALTRFLSGMLFGVSATDPLTFVAATLLLGGVALLACLVPARRAASVDPIVALRSE